MVGHGGILAFDEQTDMRALASHLLRFGAHESCGKCFPCRIGLQRAHDEFAADAAGRPGALRGAAGDARARVACARTAAACRPRSAACSRHFPDELGGLSMALTVTVDGTPVEVADGATMLEAAKLADRVDADALLRRAPGAVRRLPRLPGRGRGRAQAAARPARRRAATGWRSTPTTRPRAGSRPRSSSSCSPSCPSRPSPTPSSPRSPIALEIVAAALAGRDARRVDHDDRHPYLAFQHELCISCGRCVRACDEVQGAFALTATGRGFHCQHRRPGSTPASRTPPASPAAPAPTPARPTRSPRSRCSTASSRPTRRRPPTGGRKRRRLASE